MANRLGPEYDKLYEAAKNIVIRDRKASTSYIQRQLRIGYNMAATIIDDLEDAGVISMPDNTGRRTVIK